MGMFAICNLKGNRNAATYRLGREELQQWRIINIQAGKPVLVEPETHQDFEKGQSRSSLK